MDNRRTGIIFAHLYDKLRAAGGITMNFRLLATLFIMLGFWVWGGYRIFLSYHFQTENEKHKAELVFTMNQFNKMSLKAKALKERAEELSGANEALIEHCRPCDVTKAIKATPLPPMKKAQV